MPESYFPTFRKIGHTPIRDIIQLRLTGRLDWKSKLAAADLPAPLKALISRVVKRTRLFRLEKTAVAAELTSHFLDGVAAGASPQTLIDSFGNERLAARLIRRAKRRNRSWPWHCLDLAIKSAAILTLIFLGLLLRFFLSQANPKIDYRALINSNVEMTPPSDRAWPLWREAILSIAIRRGDHLDFPSQISTSSNPDEKPAWSEIADWLLHHQHEVQLIRKAAAKPSLGFIAGAVGSTDDAEMFGPLAYQQSRVDPLISILLPHLSYFRHLAMLLSLDARRAAESGDATTAIADLHALRGLGRQLRGSDDLIISQLVGLAADSLAVERLQTILQNHASLLNDATLIGLMQELSGPKVAADLVRITTEQYVFYDTIQRIYTDDGHGSGHLTFTGMRSLGMLPLPPQSGDRYVDFNPDFLGIVVICSVPMATFSRSQLLGTYDHIMKLTQKNFESPIRLIDTQAVLNELMSMAKSPTDRLRYMTLVQLIPDLSRAQVSCERYLGERDGTLVGIALELFHREKGNYPETLAQLVPRFLPAVPMDRIDGQPVRYRLIDGKPVVYSIGMDRKDDGGVPPRPESNSAGFAAEWDQIRPKAQGDWILYPVTSSLD